MTLNRQIELFKPAIGRNESGQKVRGFTSEGLVYCDINNRRGTEKYQSWLTVSENLTLFTIRYNTEIDPTWFLEHNGTQYEILNLIEESRKHWMHIVGRYRDNEQSGTS